MILFAGLLQRGENIDVNVFIYKQQSMHSNQPMTYLLPVDMALSN